MSRATSNVIAFPVDDLSRLRLRLAGCRNTRQLASWEAAFHKAKASLPETARAVLAASCAIARMQLKGQWPSLPEDAA